MIELIFAWKRVQERHRSAPLLKERERYLVHLREQGFTRERLSTTANLLLQIVRVMSLTEMRTVSEAEIREAAMRWSVDVDGHLGGQPGPGSERVFRWCAIHWFSFHKVLLPTPQPEPPFFEFLADFIRAGNERGLSPVTVQCYAERAGYFLTWFAGRFEDNLAAVRPSHVFDYMDEKVAAGWTAQTRATMSQALRSFFRHAESREWCVKGIARCIKSPRLPKYEQAPRGPAWKDVRRLIKLTRTDRSADMRALPVLLLCSVYGMRATEIARLRLDDIDWRNETITIRRAKRGRIQQFPLQYEVGEAIIRYLQYVRPQCDVRTVFTTLTRPFRPIRSQFVWVLVGRRMRKHGIQLVHVGPHALRHACATQLLKKGSSLQQIADFLGHRDIKSVSIYARHDPKMLRSVAAFSLAGVL
jgi:integrase/recombinase XerD